MTLSILPRCREVTELLTEHSEGRLHGVDGFRVRLHLAICPGCSCLRRQIDATREALGKLPEAPASEELKARLLRELRKPHEPE